MGRSGELVNVNSSLKTLLKFTRRVPWAKKLKVTLRENEESEVII